MVHSISNNLRQHLSSQCTTTALLWKITRTDDKVFAFTNHADDIYYNDVLYKSNDTVDISSIATKSDLSVDNTDIIGYLKQIGVNEVDILADLFDEAVVEVILVDYNNLHYGHLTLKYGYIGEIQKGSQIFTAEVRGLTQKLEQNFGQLTSPTCRARFCNNKCKININGSYLGYKLKSNGIVNEVVDNRLIVDNSRIEPVGFFNYGYILFNSGKNINQKVEIKNFDKNKILLFLPMNKDININDTFEIYAGCDKLFTTCVNKYNNAINFRGEPHLPGSDKIYETASTRTSGTNRYSNNDY